MTTAVCSNENIDYSDLEAKYRVSLDEDFDNILVIDNLPKVDSSKEEKLMNVLRKNLFVPVGAVPREGGSLMPRDPVSGLSCGYLFVEFQDSGIAASVLKIANGYRLDKSHVLSALKFTDFEGLKDEVEYVEPVVEPFVEKEFLKSWLLDERARDQFVTCSGNLTSVFYNNRDGAPEPCFSRANWTDGAVKWSPLGTFLCTFHSQGIALWGGESWHKLCRFPHVNVKGAFFSPRETFVVTQSAFDASNPQEPNVLVWHVQTGKVMRGFVCDELGGDVGALEGQSVLEWSFDDSHVSRVSGSTGAITIYAVDAGGTAAFSLLENGVISQQRGVRAVSWSPVDLSLVYWVPGTENAPARVSLWSLPHGQIIRTKNLFNVQDVSVHWQCDGDLLAVKVDRFAHKNRKNLTSSVELFRLRVRDVPVEVVEFPGLMERIDHFSWEPHGSRFLTNQTVEFRSVVSVFRVDPAGVQHLQTLERKQLTAWQWSPRGEYFVLAGLDSTAAFLEFWQAPFANTGEIVCLGTKEHFMATDMSWDPSGRFLCSWVSYWRHQMENGYILWDFKGDLVSKQAQARFTAFYWRPRPATLLSRAALKDVKKNLKSLSARYEAQDAATHAQSSSSASASRKKMLDDWVLYRVKSSTLLAAKAKLRESLQSAKKPETATRVVQEWVEDGLIEEISRVELAQE
jgi:translation initiation factor 3 subunit B